MIRIVYKEFLLFNTIKKHNNQQGQGKSVLVTQYVFVNQHQN